MNVVLEDLTQLLQNSQLRTTSEYIQHGDTTCLLHTFAVAYYSIRFAEYLGIDYKKGELIRGALLHDYFLYDWHDGNHKLHGFTHPSCALENAGKDFSLTLTECDIIKKHMFPLTILPPKCRESWIVCCVDKACSLYETFARNTYPTLRELLEYV